MKQHPRRRELLERIFALKKTLEELSWQSAMGHAGPPGAQQELVGQLLELTDAYRNSLEPVALSRCPFSGEPWSRKIDLGGLDGLWWDYQASVREPALVPATWMAFLGSVATREPLEDFPFLCKPGPGVPYLLPGLLETEGAKAVLSQVPVGDHRGFAMVYYAPSPGGAREIPNEWGSDHVAFVGPGGEFYNTRSYLDEDEFDYDLGPYLDREQLLWIEPGDAALRLRSGREGCPYLDLPGIRELQFLSGGTRWTASTAAAAASALEAASLEESATAPVPAGPAHCPGCGSPLRPEANFCGNCGRPVASQE